MFKRADFYRVAISYSEWPREWSSGRYSPFMFEEPSAFLRWPTVRHLCWKDNGVDRPPAVLRELDCMAHSEADDDSPCLGICSYFRALLTVKKLLVQKANGLDLRATVQLKA